MKYDFSSADVQYENLSQSQCRLLCLRSPDCLAWTRSVRAQCVNIKTELGKQEEIGWTLGSKYCGSK